MRIRWVGVVMLLGTAHAEAQTISGFVRDSADTGTVRFERGIDRRSGGVIQQTTHRSQGPRIAPFVAAYPASEFATRGYMVGESANRIFNAPDADVLLDPSFAEKHCFSVR